MPLDSTHDLNRQSWVASANDPASDFPIQNLPYCVFSTADDPHHRIGVGIGDQILNVRTLVERKVLQGISPEAACALCATHLNDFMKIGRSAWSSVRQALSELLHAECATLRDDHALQLEVLVAQSDAQLHRPALIGDYTDFYASIHHATNVGSMFRPDNPLLPNYQHIPIGYHGRASSIVISGTPVRRPHGQLKADDAPPIYAPCRLLDYEMEMGVFIGRGNALGSTIPVGEANDYLFGMVILNDWSARDIQKWEYQPLGPFNAKNFASTISPWVVTFDALAPFRISGPLRRADDPQPLPYLQPPAGPEHAYGIDMYVEVYIASKQMREQGIDPMRISRGNFSEMYWTVAQMLVHHASGGCNMQPGDLLGSGTISNTDEDTRGCLLERTWRGEQPISLPDGTERKFLQDGDEVIMRAYCEKPGARRIGFGECRGVILPAE